MRLFSIVSTLCLATLALAQQGPPTTAQLWDVNYYYNYLHGVHAYCADDKCIATIQKNGIGYDMNNGKGLLGKAVSEATGNTVAGCDQLVHLGFTKSGKHYDHNLDGRGLRQGWVARTEGYCGARVPIKRWKSKFTDDIMYGVDLEWNTWYSGMEMDDGQVLFYMWE